MGKNILIGLALIFALSCNKDDDVDLIKQNNGKVWLSGGLIYCANQIHLDNGDTLIADFKDLIAFKTGDMVSVKYKEMGINKNCPSGIDCKIIEINKVE